ncbi:MAG: hypothetical protein ACRBBN_17495 [Methyloligellaceae bacterium]
MTIFLWIACAVSVFAFCLHTFKGGVMIARPLLANTDLPKASKYLNYLCWHAVTVFVAAIAIAFLWMAVIKVEPALLFFLASLCAATALLCLWVERKFGLRPFSFPPTWLFPILSGLGWAALLSQ